MLSAPRSLALNAICLYIAAYLVTIVLHEMGHAAMALALGDHPVLYSTSVTNTNPLLSNAAHVLISVAGPLVSLAQGVALLALARRQRSAGPGALFTLYLGVFGLINFLGYLMIAPLVAGGDTGQMVVRLRVPAWATWAVAVLALLALIRSIGSTGPLFAHLLPPAALADDAQKATGLKALILWPWLLGSVVLVLLALPAPHPAIVANMFMSPMVLRRAYAVAATVPAGAPAAAEGPRGLEQPQWGLLLAAALLALVFKALGHGVAL